MDAFHWNSSAQTSFDFLKEALTKALILSLLDFTKIFVLQTYASGTGIGTILTQNGHPISYSKKLCPKLQIHQLTYGDYMQSLRLSRNDDITF